MFLNLSQDPNHTTPKTTTTLSTGKFNAHNVKLFCFIIIHEYLRINIVRARGFKVYVRLQTNIISWMANIAKANIFKAIQRS